MIAKKCGVMVVSMSFVCLVSHAMNEGGAGGRRSREGSPNRDVQSGQQVQQARYVYEGRDRGPQEGELDDFEFGDYDGPGGVEGAGANGREHVNAKEIVSLVGTMLVDSLCSAMHSAHEYVSRANPNEEPGKQRWIDTARRAMDPLLYGSVNVEAAKLGIQCPEMNSSTFDGYASEVITERIVKKLYARQKLTPQEKKTYLRRVVALHSLCVDVLGEELPQTARETQAVVGASDIATQLLNKDGLPRIMLCKGLLDSLALKRVEMAQGVCDYMRYASVLESQQTAARLEQARVEARGEGEEKEGDGREGVVQQREIHHV